MAPSPRRSSHLHSCSECHETYEDTCLVPAFNGRCNSCISGITSRYGFGRWPALCCYQFTRTARPDEIKRYHLAGPGPWFICHTCKRPLGYDPAKDRP